MKCFFSYQQRVPNQLIIMSTSKCSQTQENGYQIPTVPFYLATSNRPIEEICDVTDYLTKLNPEFIVDMLKAICTRQIKGTSFYGEFKAPPPRIAQQVNGRGGYFLKETAKPENANIYLAWYNAKENVYMFWGPTKFKVVDAMKRIRSRIVKYFIEDEQRLPVVHFRPSSPPSQIEVPRSFGYNYGRASRAFCPSPSPSPIPTSYVPEQNINYNYDLPRPDISSSPPPPPTRQPPTRQPMLRSISIRAMPCPIERSCSIQYPKLPSLEDISN